jgi:hypothetical protein
MHDRTRGLTISLLKPPITDGQRTTSIGRASWTGASPLRIKSEQTRSKHARWRETGLYNKEHISRTTRWVPVAREFATAAGYGKDDGFATLDPTARDPLPTATATDQCPWLPSNQKSWKLSYDWTEKGQLISRLGGELQKEGASCVAAKRGAVPTGAVILNY